MNLPNERAVVSFRRGVSLLESDVAFGGTPRRFHFGRRACSHSTFFVFASCTWMKGTTFFDQRTAVFLPFFQVHRANQDAAASLCLHGSVQHSSCIPCIRSEKLWDTLWEKAIKPCMCCPVSLLASSPQTSGVSRGTGALGEVLNAHIPTRGGVRSVSACRLLTASRIYGGLTSLQESFMDMAPAGQCCKSSCAPSFSTELAS